MAKIFVSYKRGETDQLELIAEIRRQFGRTHQFFVDTELNAGDPRKAKLLEELRASDWVLVLLSDATFRSPEVLSEIEAAHKACRNQGHPQLLPVRMRYANSYPVPWSDYLNSVQWTGWDGPAHTQGLIQRLATTLSDTATQHARQLADDTRAVALAGVNARIPIGAVLLDRPVVDPQHRRRQLSDVIATTRHVLLEGSSGSGKTTLLRRLAHDHAIAYAPGTKPRRRLVPELVAGGDRPWSPLELAWVTAKY